MIDKDVTPLFYSNIIDLSKECFRQIPLKIEMHQFLQKQIVYYFW